MVLSGVAVAAGKAPGAWQGRGGAGQIQFDIAESGKVENCRDVPTGQEGVLDFMPSPCSWGPGPYVPPLDAAGKPHATTGTMEVAISRTP